ncbi:cupin domain-containing protein [Natronorubrum sp. FCH18a]|uniref:cupin domain-containing protein n=1 Tax=Natronorubrum sp. FCH18a TaxID=3447018 RepID=UPI003F5115FA
MADPDLPPTPTERRRLDELDVTPHAHLFDGEPQTIRLALADGERIPAHRHPDRAIVLHVLEGHLTVTLGDDEYDVRERDVVRFDGAQDTSPKAQADTTALLVLARRPTDQLLVSGSSTVSSVSTLGRSSTNRLMIASSAR